MAKGKRPFGYTIPFMDGIGFVPPTIYTPRIAINWCWRVGRPLTDFSSITDNILRSWKDGVAPKKKRKKKRRNLLDTVNASVRSIESCVDWVWKWTSEEINHIVPHSFFFGECGAIWILKVIIHSRIRSSAVWKSSPNGKSMAKSIYSFLEGILLNQQPCERKKGEKSIWYHENPRFAELEQNCRCRSDCRSLENAAQFSFESIWIRSENEIWRAIFLSLYLNAQLMECVRDLNERRSFLGCHRWLDFLLSWKEKWYTIPSYGILDAHLRLIKDDTYLLTGTVCLWPNHAPHSTFNYALQPVNHCAIQTILFICFCIDRV